MSKKAILCVDDEKMVLISLRKQLLKRFGNKYHYEIAENAEEAWEVIEELHEEGVEILVIVADWLMPGVKGDEFLIQVHERFPRIVKVLLTGHADEAAVERARKYAGLHGCLYKPWSEKDLVETIMAGLD